MNYNIAFKIIRGATGLTQSQFAKTVDIEPSLLSRIESGARVPTQRTLELISEKLTISMELIELLSKETSDVNNIDNKKLALIGEELMKLLMNARNGKW
jgi:transcriptional regulator with XRE-family HTH domain